MPGEVVSPPFLSFIVPGEPMPKERAEPTIGKRRGESGETKHFVRFRAGERTADYEAKVRWIAEANRPTGWPRRCRFRVDIEIHRSAKGDKDNYEKAILDAVNPRRARYEGKGPSRCLVSPAIPGVLWIDDSHVYEGSQRIVDVAPNDAHAVVHVTAIPVRCSLSSCRREIFVVDESDRCETCAEKAGQRKARSQKRSLLKGAPPSLLRAIEAEQARTRRSV